MKSMIVVALGMFSVFCFICYANDGMNRDDECKSEDNGIHEVLDESSEIITKKFPLVPFGTSVGFPSGKVITLLGNHFQLVGHYSKEELRKMILVTTREFLKVVDKNKKIRPYLEKYPFEISKVDITFFIIDSKGCSLDDPYIGVAGIYEGDLFYDISERVDGILKTKSYETETYEDAMKAAGL